MTVSKLLIANRGEIAIRIAQAAADVGIETVGIYSTDDAASQHHSVCDHAVALPGSGPRAYLDGAAIVKAAQQAGCDAVHPGYGFLSENAEFAEQVRAAGLRFVGPSADILRLFGDKVKARELAQAQDVPVIDGLSRIEDTAEATEFLASLPAGSAIMIKAMSGGGGRGMRVVRDPAAVEQAVATCRAEAQQAFGDPGLYAERLIANARHIEVQVLGDGTGAVQQFGERECTLQRRHQKLIEIAPSPSLRPETREALFDAALKLARAVNYQGLGTFEFLVEGDDQQPWFIEANPRLQVEHTVTEELLGIDLVKLQLAVAGGTSLSDLGLGPTEAKGFAIQCRVTMEDMDDTGAPRPAAGTISRYEPPTGPGIRVDGFAYGGYAVTTVFDPLLAKVITRSPAPDFAVATAKSDRALGRFGIDGVATNIPVLRALLNRDDVRANAVTTHTVEDILPELAKAQAMYRPKPADVAPSATTPDQPQLAMDEFAVAAPIQATIARIEVTEGQAVAVGTPIAVLEAMKMEHVVTADTPGTVRRITAAPGETMTDGQIMVVMGPGGMDAAEQQADLKLDPDALRPELQELNQRIAHGLDDARTARVAKRKARGQSTARENLAQLCDTDSFEEYGALALAAQTNRRTQEDLIENTTGDGVITGFGAVNADLFGPDQSRCALAVYDYMVLAGTQGKRNHDKQDRVFELARKWKLPVILFAEGGGGRPGDNDSGKIAGLEVPTFATFAALSGQVPLIGVVAGRCFAGNAALLGCCDVIIATEDSNIGMAGPAMIEGGGLGRFAPEDIGPIDVQTRNGVVDIRVADEVEGCAVAKQYLSYFQGALPDYTAPDQRLLRHAIPENRKQVHDARRVIDGLCDDGSVLELRPDYGIGILTALVRIEGRAFGLMANNAHHLGGAIDGPAALKAARFMDQCNAQGLPIISLCDTPGFLVGPEAEKTGLVRHVCEMFLSAARLDVPIFGIVLRKGYGLGAMAMVGGGFHENACTISWPTGEFGGMGLEGAVHLGYRKELDAITDPAEKQALFEQLLARYYDRGKAISVATTFEIDAVIDPADTRRWISNSARSFSRRTS